MPPAPVKIERISGDRTRQNTFHKRKLGLIKKAIELTVLCDCDIAIIMRSGPTIMCPEGKMSAYCNKDLDAMIADYMTEPPQEQYTNAEYARLSKSEVSFTQPYGAPMMFGAPPPMLAMPTLSAVQVKLEPESQSRSNPRSTSVSDSEDAEEMKQRLASMEEELERLRTKVASGNSAVEGESKVGCKRSTPPSSCGEVDSTATDSSSKRQCTQPSIAYSIEVEDPNLGNLIDNLEGMENSSAPDALTLKHEPSGSLAPLMLRLGRELSWSNCRLGRETSWDLASLLASTPTHGTSPCNRLVPSGVKSAGCPLLARA